jgi:hypothetical protein
MELPPLSSCEHLILLTQCYSTMGIVRTGESKLYFTKGTWHSGLPYTHTRCPFSLHPDIVEREKTKVAYTISTGLGLLVCH